MKGVTAREFAATWSDPSLAEFRKEMGNTLSPLGGKAKQIYADVTTFFSDSVSNFLAEDPQEIVDAGKKFAESQTAKDATTITQMPKDFISGMKRQVDQMMIDIDYSINEAADGIEKVKAAVGASVAVTTINEIVSNLSTLVVEETGETAIAIADSLQKSLSRVAESYENAAIIPQGAKELIEKVKIPNRGNTKQQELLKQEKREKVLSNIKKLLREVKQQIEAAK